MKSNLKHRVNISSSFMTRTCCKFCGGPPAVHYICAKPKLWDDIKIYRDATLSIYRWIQRMCVSWYKDFSPREFDGIYEFSFILSNKNYRPLLNRTRHFFTQNKNYFNFIDCLTCNCGHSIWYYNQKSIKKRPEIFYRKGRFTYPQKFED